MKYILAFSLLFVATLTIAQAPAVPQASVVVSSLSQLTGYTGSLLQANWTDANRGGKFDLVDAAGLTVDNGVVYASAKAGKYWKRDISQTQAVNVKWFGAVGDSSTDETVAFQSAAATRLPIFIPDGHFIVKKPITVYNDVIGESRNAAIVWKDSVTLFFLGADNISITNLTAVADTLAITITSPRFINTNSYNNVQLDNDSIVNSRVIFSSNRIDGSKGISVTNCVLEANFNHYNIETAQHDLITIQGYKGVLFDKNRIHALNMHRVWKISAALIPGGIVTGDTDSLSNYASEDIMIRNNTIFSSSRVRFQFMDLFAGTVDFTFKDNWVEAYGHSALIQNKNTQHNSNPFNIKINGNHFRWAGTDDVSHPRSGLAMQGVYGKMGQVDSLYFDNVDISDNTFEDTNSLSLSYAVEVRFYNSARVHHNDFVNTGHGKTNPWIKIGSTQSFIVSNNTLQTGHIELLNYRNNLNGDSFIVSRVDGKVVSNFIADFAGFASGIYVSRIAQPTGTIEISHNTIRQVYDDTTSVAAIYLSSDTLSTISLVGNIAALANTTKNKIRLANNVFGTYLESINSWQGSAIANRGQAIGEDLSLGTLDSFNISIMTDAHKRINFMANGKIQVGETVFDSLGVINIHRNESTTAFGLSPMSIRFRNVNSAGSTILGGMVFEAGGDTTSKWTTAAISGVKEGSSGSGAIGGIALSTKTAVGDTVLLERFRVTANGNIGIGTSTPHAKALAQFESTTKGILLPRMTRAQFAAITSKPNGLMAFGTTLNKVIVWDSTNSITKVLADSADVAAQISGATSTGAYDVSYAGTETWTGTAPTSLIDHRYSWTKTGRTVTFEFYTKYTNAGTGLTALTLSWPSDLPLPLEMTSVSNGEMIIGGSGRLQVTQGTSTATAGNVVIKRSGTATYQIIILSTSAAYAAAYCTITYISAN